MHLKLINTSFNLTLKTAAQAEVFLVDCLSFLSTLAATFGAWNLAFFWLYKVGWNFKNLMRLFPPKSGPKHTFHNFQLIELLRLRFVRWSSLLPPSSAVGTRSFSLMRKFMNIFYKMNSASGGAYPVGRLIDLMSFSLHIYRVAAVLVLLFMGNLLAF